MNVDRIESYADCQALLNTPQREENGRKLRHNVRLEKRGDDYAIVHHSTAIVTYHTDGSFALDNGGWYSVTTKANINHYAPVSLWQERFEWFLTYRGETLPYENGMRLGSETLEHVA